MDKEIPIIKDCPNRVVGLREIVRGITVDHIRCVLIACDADEHIRRKLKAVCSTHNVALKTIPFTKEEIGKYVGIEVACASVGIPKTE